MHFARPAPRTLIAAIAAGVVLVGVGTAAVIAATGSSSGHQKVGSVSQGDLPPATLAVAHLHGKKVPVGRQLRLTVANGAFSTVAVKQRGSGRLHGSFNPTHTRWRSASIVGPSSRLRASVTYVDLSHTTLHKTLTLRTRSAKAHVNALLSPGGNAVVGVGSPVVVSFDRPIPTSKQAAVEAGLSVTTKPKVVGAWHWMSDQVVHWRPPTYWKPGTKVTVSSYLQNVKIARGEWGAVGHHSTSFKIGPSHISIVNQATHQMNVYDDGKLIKTFPVSTGRSQYPTMDGVHIALAKSPVVEMDSATVGIPKGSPGYYDETVYWDVRISNGGEFVHAAPWSVGDQGHVNVSHGCVNLSTTNAQWFFHWALNGDVVDVYNGVRPPESGDPGTADWNMSWKQWLAGDASPTAAAKALHPGMPRLQEPGFGPPKHATHKHATHKSSRSHSS